LTTLLRGMYGQLEVVHALVLRETRTRFGAYQLGYLWALLEPILAITTFYILFRLGNREPPYEMDLIGFIGTGVVPYTLFASTAARVTESINGNKALLFYPRVNVLDLVMARTLLEWVTYSWVFIAIMTTNAIYSKHLAVDEPLYVMGGLVLASLLGASVGLIFCGLSQLSNAVERARGPMMRPLFWISGIFFAADALPSSARHALLHNPVLHCVELVRGGWFPQYPADNAKPSYVLLWILGLLIGGLLLERVVRRRIEVT